MDIIPDSWVPDWWYSGKPVNELKPDEPMTGDPYKSAIEAGLDKVAGTDVANKVMGISSDQTLSQSKYDFSYLTFPNDLGMDYLGHYMVININVPIAFGSEQASTSLPQNAGPNMSNGGLPYNVLAGEMSKVDVLRFSGGQSLKAMNNQNSAFYGRRTRRIVQSIALYMPGSQLIYNTINDYEEIALTPLAGKLAAGAVGTLISAAAGGFGGAIGGFISAGGGAISSGSSVLGSVAETTAKLANRPINPRVEVLFAKTNLREFQFEFLFMPRNAEEAETIRRIVRTLRFHAAPELMSWGFQWIPPAEFDITFFHRGVETDKIPRINTCVLRRIEVDYAPGTGVFSAYKDGNPFSTRLMLVFSEVEILHKKRIQQGF